MYFCNLEAIAPSSSEDVNGLVGTFSIAENLVLDTHGLAPFSKVGQLSANKISDNATKLKAEFDIRAQSIYDTANSLSGGNKQKVVLARELSRQVKVVVGVNRAEYRLIRLLCAILPFL